MIRADETRHAAYLGQVDRHDGELRASAPSNVIAACASSAAAGDSLTISIALPPGRANQLTPAELHAIGDHVLRVLVAPVAADRCGTSCTAAPATALVRRPVHARKARVAAAADAVRAFIDAQCVLDKNASEQASVLHRAYGSWASARNMPRLCGRTFGMAMGALGYERQKSCNSFWWGLRLERREAAP